MKLYERSYPALLICFLEIKINFVLNFYIIRQVILIIMELTMKIHSLLLCHDKDDGCRYVLDSGYFAKLRKKHDPILIG